MGAASRTTFQQIVAAVQRMPSLEKVSLGEIIDAVKLAAVDIGNQPWPWNYAETNILVPAPLSTGTVSITDGTATVTGVGTSFPTGQYGWRIRFGTNNLDYIVASVGNATTLTLAQPVNLGANLSGSGYTLYKDTYLYPADYIFGSDVGLYQPVIRTRIQKIPRSKFEAAMNAGLRSFSTNITQYYCDAGVFVDPLVVTATKYFQFRIAPPSSSAAELRLCYHSIANTFTTNLNVQTDLPDGFDEILELMAASKLYDQMMQPGTSAQVKALAEGKIKLLKRTVSTQTIDDIPDPNTEVSDSSISQWGMTIARM